METGGCPHTAIREDASINLAAVDELPQRFNDLDIVFVESGGDNLSATFSPELADITVYVIDVAAGEKIPRKGGPGITRSDLLVINKTDLAPLVGADLGVMERDARRMRGERPFLFSNLKTGEGVDQNREKAQEWFGMVLIAYAQWLKAGEDKSPTPPMATMAPKFFSMVNTNGRLTLRTSKVGLKLNWKTTASTLLSKESKPQFITAQRS